MAVPFDPGTALFQVSSPGHVGPRPHRDPVSDTVEPRSQSMMVAESACLAHKDQKGRLKCILDVVRVGEYAAADPQHHRTMAGHQAGECGLGRILIRPGPEPIKQLRVGQAIASPDVEERVDVAEDRR